MLGTPLGRLLHSSPQAGPLTRGLVIGLPLSEEYGPLVDQISGTTFARTYATKPGVVSALGKYGYACQFSQTNGNYLSGPDSPAVRLGDRDSTVAFRLYLDSNAFFGLVDKGASAEWAIFYNNANSKLRARYIAGTTTTVDYSQALSTATWYDVRCWRTKSPNKLYVQIDSGAIESNDVSGAGLATAAWQLGNNGSNYLAGRMQDFCVWNRVLSDTEWLQYRSGARPPMFHVTTNTINFIKPSNYQVFQQSSGTATVGVKGEYTGSPTAIEYKLDSGAWTSGDAAPANGRFTFNVASVATGWHTLTVRFANDTGCTAALSLVGVGDVFGLWGQSNCSGRGNNLQTFTPNGSITAALFGNDYRWKVLADKTDSNTDGEDTVSADGPAAGSMWPLVGTSWVNGRATPIAFVAAAKGNTSITDWLPGADHQDRTTLYGSGVYKCLSAGGVRGVLWLQGENDAVSMDQATYNGHLDTIANAVNTDLGVKLMPAKLPTLKASTYPNQGLINAAIAEAWGDNANVATGPDLTSVDVSSTTPPNDGVHVATDAQLSSCASLWYAAMNTAFP